MITGHDGSLSGDIVVPESTLMICSEAFSAVKNVRSIALPKTVNLISYGAFQGCEAIVIVDRDNANYSSGASGELLNKNGTVLMFVPAKETSYLIPDNVRSIAKYAFYGCDKLSVLRIPETVSSIDDMAFVKSAPIFRVSESSVVYSSDEQGCLYDKFKTKILSVPNVLSSVTIPSSVCTIGDYACYANTNLTGLVIPSSVTAIGDYAFWGCTSLLSVVLREGLLRIGEDAFYGCKMLSELLLPDGLVEVGDYSFTGCKKLALVRFPSSIEKIGAYAFGNTAIEKLNIATAGNLEIGTLAFEDCSIEKLNIETSGNLEVGTWAFMNCSRLNNVDVKAKTISIGWTFDYCVNLQMVTLAADSIALGTWAFMGCSSLKSVCIFGQNLTSDSADVYYYCPNDLVTYVLQGTAGWCDGEGGLPSMWQERAIRYYVEPSPIPDLGANPTANAIANALRDSCDVRLGKYITNGVAYAAYRDWASTVKTSDGCAAAGMQRVKDSPHAWLAFALDSEILIESAPVNSDLKVDKFEAQKTAHAFDFTIRIDGVRVGDGATADNLARVLGIEGAEVLDADKFAFENVDVSFRAPKDGNVLLRACPKDGRNPAFFMRARMIP